MPNGWKLYSRQWAFWAPSIELTLHTTLHCSNLTLSFSPSLALNWEDGRSTCATYTLEHQPWSENQKCPMSVSWIGRYLNYGPHCTVRSVIRYLPKHILGRYHFEHYSVPSQNTLPASGRLIAGPRIASGRLIASSDLKGTLLSKVRLANKRFVANGNWWRSLLMRPPTSTVCQSNNTLPWIKFPPVWHFLWGPEISFIMIIFSTPQNVWKHIHFCPKSKFSTWHEAESKLENSTTPKPNATFFKFRLHRPVRPL